MPETMLEKYQRRLKEAEIHIKSNGATSSLLLTYQELLYRIDVLSALQMYATAAPVGQDVPVMIAHYQMLDGFIHGLLMERQNGIPADDELMKRRQTAHMNLCRVVEDYHKRFSSFVPGEPEQYKNEINRISMTVLSAWISFRNVFIPLSQLEEAA